MREDPTHRIKSAIFHRPDRDQITERVDIHTSGSMRHLQKGRDSINSDMLNLKQESTDPFT